MRHTTIAFFREMQFWSHCYTAVSYQALFRLSVYKIPAVYLSGAKMCVFARYATLVPRLSLASLVMPISDPQDGCFNPTLTLLIDSYRVKSVKFGHQVNSDTHLQTVEIQMRLLLMSRLIRIFTVCLVNLFFIPITEL